MKRWVEYRPGKRTKPFLVLLFILATVFVAESLFMMLLHDQGIPPMWGAVLDASFLVLLLVPLLYILLLHPLISQMRELDETRRKRSELNEQLEALWQGSGVGITLINPAHGARIIDCNPHLCSMLGYGREEVIGKPLRVLSEEQDFGAEFDWLSSLPSGTQQEGQERYRSKSGRIIEVATTYTRSRVGGRELIVRFDRDVTDLVETQSELERERAQWQALLDNISDHVYIKDTASRFLRVSDSLAKQHGMGTAAEMIGHTDFDYFTTGHAEEAFADEQEIMRSGEPMINKLEQETYPDRPATWALSTKIPLRGPRGEIIGTCGITKDVTGLIEAQNESRRLFQAVNQSPVGIIITDRQGRIQFTNPYFTEMTGYTAEEVKGRNPRILKSGEFSNKDYQEMWRTITGGETWHGLFHNRRKDGSLYWEDSSICPIRDGEGKITHFVGAKMDVTKREETEENLRTAKEAAERAARAKSEFLANMSHEIRTPMNGVIGMVGLLLDTSLNAQQREYAEMVRDSADNMVVVVNDILDFSKIEAGKIEFEQTDFNLVDLVEGSLDMLVDRAQSKGLELVDAVKPEVPTWVRGDPGRLRQILVNLIGNAIKFTDQGEVVVRVELAEEADENIVLKFRVEDTGVGIPPEALDRLFESFEQADNSVTRKYGGTGLGLSISRQLTKLMGGEIGVESELGRGSTFWFTARLERPEAAMPKHCPENSRLAHLKVLVVDDNATNRQVLRHQIYAWHMQKGSAAGGHEALKVLRQAAADGSPYDVALLDQEMPEMDGLALARAIKDDPRISSTRLVLLTHLGQVPAEEALKTAGIDGQVAKPVKQSPLFDALLEVVGSNETVANQTSGKPGPTDQAAPFEKFKALLVEDNMVNQRVASTLLRKMGADVTIAGNGAIALEKLAHEDFEVVCMDCQMPEMDGYTAAREIRRMEDEDAEHCAWSVPVPIIAMTANAMQGDREKCLEAGMDDFVSKPVRSAKLQTALEPYLAHADYH